VATGTIKKIVADRGFGFIVAEDAKEYFFHRNALDASLDFDRLVGGERVQFEIESSPKGPRAEQVHRLSLGQWQNRVLDLAAHAESLSAGDQQAEVGTGLDQGRELGRGVEVALERMHAAHAAHGERIEALGQQAFGDALLHPLGADRADDGQLLQRDQLFVAHVPALGSKARSRAICS